ncbi:MAG: proprotein convertase P-domain-containing protein, partial [Mycobacterium sp.]|nr:proprotein convertase P-domain-containing protein [Mycobacterium sp.]
ASPVAGTYALEIQVSDGLGGVATQDWTLTATASAPNRPPVITSKPVLQGLVGSPYRYGAGATDPDGDSVTYSLEAGAPSWLSITYGAVYGTPGAAGNYPVTVVADDGHGNEAYQSFTIEVTEDQGPTISSTPVTSVTAGGTYEYDVVASDPDGDLLQYQVDMQRPQGFEDDPSQPMVDWHGHVTWNPGTEFVGSFWPMLVTVSDLHGYSFSQSYVLSVNADTTPPGVVVQVSADQADMGQSVTVTVRATDDVAVSSLSLTENGQPVVLNAQGQAKVVLPTTGTVTFVGSATDPSGNVGTSPSSVVTVIDPSVTDVPTASIASLASTQNATNGADATTHLPVFAPLTVGPGASVSSPITVNDPSSVQSLALALNITASDDSGLTATLTGPNGHTVTLFSGLSGTNLTNATFDDGASGGIGSGSAPYSGTFHPEQALAALAGSAASGTYTLTLTNSSTSTTATVSGWSLTYRKSVQSEVTAPVQIVGTANDAEQLSSWTLRVSAAGSANTTLLGSGGSPVVNGVLGSFDPTMLADGPYVLELRVTNAGGHTTVVEQTVTVTGSLKLGNLHLSFTDLTVPVAGIPITITRTYDTLNAGVEGDFGYGWTLNEGNAQLAVSQPNGGTSAQAPFSDGTRVTITLPGGQPETFTFAPQPVVTGYFVLPYYDPAFVPDPGVTDTLTVEADTLFANGDGTYSGLDGEQTPYTPADPTFGGSYTLTTRQGLTYVIDASTGVLETESDRNGNTLTFSASGISSNSGRAVTFTRDPNTGNITAITDPRGNRIVYGYDGSGNLVSVTDRDGKTTQFVYNTGMPHYVDHVIDAQGQTVAQVTYTTAGRVSGITDALGNTSTVTSDDAGELNTSVTAPGSSPTAVTYDGEGNVTGTVDAAGNATSATYSGNNLASQTQTVDGTPETTTYTYDAYGEVLTATDAQGNTTYFTYNAQGEPVTSTDALGNTTTFRYDGNGNLVSTTDPDGVTTSMTYDAYGNVLSITTPDGTTHSTYDGYGDVTSTTDAQGTTTTYTYDADGNPKTSQWTWVSGSTQQVLTTTNIYDGNDHLIQSTAADGTVTETVYDSSGHAVWTDVPHVPGQAANGTHTTYDAAGRVISTEQYHNVAIIINNPNSSAPTSILSSSDATPFSVTDTSYDAQGRVQWTDDAHLPGQPCDGTLTTYDAAGNAKSTERYGNVVITAGTPISHGALLSSTSTTYDAAGNVISTTSAGGAVTTYAYNAAGQQTEARTTANGVTSTTTTTYDAAGRVTSTTDALGHTTHYVYDGDGHLVKTVFPDGGTSKTVYDSNGRKVASIDQDGNETDYGYDAYGNLTSVQLPAITLVYPESSYTARPTYSYSYDAYGNLLSETVPAPGLPSGQGETTSYTYDAFGHKVSETLPMGQTESWSYNALGQLASSTDFDGNTIHYTYDDQGRVTEKDDYAPHATSPSVTVTYTYDNPDTTNDGGHYDTVTTPEGLTTSYYDVNGNLVKQESPEGTIEYTYNLATGLETSVSTANTAIQYGYDALGRMSTVTVTELDGAAVSAPLVTTYGYDVNGDLVTTYQPNGTV